METAVQALIILLDYGHPIENHLASTLDPTALPPSSGLSVTTSPLQYVNPDDVDAQGFNIFRKLLGSIDTPDQLNFMFRGFSRLLNNLHQSQTTYLPYSVTKIDIEQELMVLLWKCLEEVPKFMPYILRYSITPALSFTLLQELRCHGVVGSNLLSHVGRKKGCPPTWSSLSLHFYTLEIIWRA